VTVTRALEGSGATSVALVDRLRAVSAPQPLLGREREQRLTGRQRAILDHLVEMFDGGFAHLTMAEIAARANCSLRTLYSLAPSRDELVLVVVDRNLWRVGRTAMAAIAPAMAPLDALQAYLGAATEAVEGMTAPFAVTSHSCPRRVGSRRRTRTTPKPSPARFSTSPSSVATSPHSTRRRRHASWPAWRPPCRAPR